MICHELLSSDGGDCPAWSTPDRTLDTLDRPPSQGYASNDISNVSRTEY
jgi:hypothetical protein